MAWVPDIIGASAIDINILIVDNMGVRPLIMNCRTIFNGMPIFLRP